EGGRELEGDLHRDVITRKTFGAPAGRRSGRVPGAAPEHAGAAQLPPMIIVTAIAGRLERHALGGRRLESVEVSFDALAKGHQRVKTDAGTDGGISHARGERLAPGDALQWLLQFASAALPLVALRHAHGLERLLQAGRVHDLATVGEWLDVHLACSAGPTDGAAVALVQAAATREDWDAVVRIDRLLTALKLAPEIQAASLSTGQAALRAAREAFPGALLGRYAGLLGEHRA